MLKQVVFDGHPWNRRFVICVGHAPHSTSPTCFEVELPEEQSLSRDQRMLCYVESAHLADLSQDQQAQVAGTFGLHLDRLPYPT